MNRKSTLLIVTMSLSFILIITLSFMFATASPNGNQQNQKQNLLSEIPEDINTNSNSGKEQQNQTTEAPRENTAEIPNEIIENSEPKVENTSEAKDTENEKDKVEKHSNETEKETQLNSSQTTQSTEKIVREDKHLNKQSNNTNILCLGVADGNLEMISVYSINKANRKSAGIFLPTRTTLKVNNQMLSLREVYSQYGINNLKKILSQCLEIDLPYHMVADQKGLVELSELIGPLYVENENIDIPNLFVRPVSDKDDEILQSLAEKIAQPKMVLQVPKLISIFIANVQSDIGVSGLWDLYKVFSNLNHSQLYKTVLWGEKVEMAGKTYWLIDPYDWHNVVYEMTQ
ncbi:MAG: hypothetical protein ACOYVD_07315 [Bacillota bacterium]